MGLPKPYYDHAGITIYHGDCRDILPHLPKVDLVLTDPPWELSDGTVRIGKGRLAPLRHESHTLKRGAVGLFDVGVIRQLLNLAAYDCLFLCGYKELADVAKACNPLRGIFAWHKPNGVPAAFYPAKMDLSFIVWGGKTSLLYGHQHWPSMVFSFPFPPAGCLATERLVEQDSGRAVHPCQGPVDLYLRLLRPFPEDKTVLDAYCGTGTTLVAAKQLGRRGIGIEIEEKYCEIAVKRLSQEMLPFEPITPRTDEQMRLLAAQDEIGEEVAEWAQKDGVSG